MCGIFGFVSHDDKGPNAKALARIAADTERRGPHAWGVAWVDNRGRLRMYKQPGRITKSLDLLEHLTRRARVLVGHTRWATHGHPKDNQTNHPHPADGGWFVHNGQVTNWRELHREYDLEPVTECDSEVLGQLLECGDAKTLVGRLRDAIAAQRGLCSFAGVWARPHRLLLARAGNPVHFTELEGRTYFASRPNVLPGDPVEMDDNTLMEIRPGRPAEWVTIIPAPPEPVLLPPPPCARSVHKITVPATPLRGGTGTAAGMDRFAEGWRYCS